MFMNKAKQFSQSEYGKETKDGKEDWYINQEDNCGGKKQDKNRNKNQMFMPNRNRKKKINSDSCLYWTEYLRFAMQLTETESS